MTYDEALNYIHGINWTFCKPGLERIGELCEKLAHPEKELKFIHVAGTNGKGSFCSMLNSVLIRAGLKVGLYTSPFILRFNERMKVDGEDISDSELATITEYVKPFADSMTDKPTEFELITAIAFEYFKRHGVDVVILEAGMGGRLDSTNIIRNPLLSVITGIALDHTAYLGDTVEKIATEKAGIIKDKTPILYGGEDDSAREVIRKIANERQSLFFDVDYSSLKVKSADIFSSVFDYKNEKDVRISLAGLYQPKNASVVIEAVELLRKQGLEITEKALKDGLNSAKWLARFEVINRNPLIIFDGAHNPQGIESATNSIKAYFKDEKVCCVTGVLKDKNYDFIAGKLAEVASDAFTMTPDSDRALTAEKYATVLNYHGVNTRPCGSVYDALKCGIELAKKDKKAIVCLGSLYTYSEVISALNKLKEN